MAFDNNIRKLIKNEIKYSSASLGFNLLISRLQKNYSANPTQVVLEDCVKEIQIFAEKYSAFMEKEIGAISKL